MSSIEHGDIEKFKRKYLEREKLCQETKFLKNQNADYSATKRRANIAIIVFIVATLLTLSGLIVQILTNQGQH